MRVVDVFLTDKLPLCATPVQPRGLKSRSVLKLWIFQLVKPMKALKSTSEHKWRRRGAFFKYQKSSSCWIKYFFRFPSGLFFCCSRIRLKNKICAYANVCQFSSRHNPAPSPDAPLSSCHSLHHVWKVLSSLTELTQLRWKFRTFYLTKILSLGRYVPKYGNVAALH